MKIVFFGTPFFAAEVLDDLLTQKVEIVAVVTQPDKPKGRSLQLSQSEVKNLVLSKRPEIPILQPRIASDASFLEMLKAFRADLFVVVAYGQILPQKLLDIPPLGCINVHASLLPKYRGAAPIQRCLMNGEKETGIAIQKMVKQLDAGDVIQETRIEISEDMTCGELERELIEIAKPLLLSVIQKYRDGIPSAKPQDPSQATYAAKIEFEEGEIDWKRSARDLHNLIRAFSPKPGAWCFVQSNGERKRLKILKSQIFSTKAAPGHSGQIFPDAMIGCGENALKLLEVQPEGKKAMSGSDYLRGQKNISFII